MPERCLKKPVTSAPEKIVMAAFDLFHANGIEGTSVDDILRKSGTGKSQFYHYFKSKDGLIHQLMEMACKKIKAGEIIGCDPIETWGDLKCWFDSSLEKMGNFDFTRVCPMGRFAVEISEGNELLRKDILMVFEAKKQHPREFFIKLKARGELKENADPETLADFCMASVQGAMLLGKINRDAKPVREVIDHAYAYLESFKKQI